MITRNFELHISINLARTERNFAVCFRFCAVVIQLLVSECLSRISFTLVAGCTYITLVIKEEYSEDGSSVCRRVVEISFVPRLKHS